MVYDSYTAALAGTGATLDETTGRPASFEDPSAELRIAIEGAVLTDRSDFARVLSTGRDILDLLHRLSTQDLKTLPPGRGNATVLTTGKGRIVERLYVFAMEPRKTWLVGGRSAGSAEKTIAHLARYTFSEDTALTDVSESTRLIVLCGPRTSEFAARAGIPDPAPLTCEPAQIASVALDVLGFDPDGGDGISFIVPAADAALVWAELLYRLRPLGVVPAGDWALESRRVMCGLPASGRELTEEHNPLEAGLWDAVSFTKGCYVGQEVVARLRTYDKVSKNILGLTLEAGAPAPDAGTRLFRNEREVGSVTSAVLPAPGSRPVALAYVKREVAPSGAALHLGTAGGPVVAAVREFPRRSATTAPVEG